MYYENLTSLINNFTKFNLTSFITFLIIVIFFAYRITEHIYNDIYKQKLNAAEIQLYKVYKPLYKIFVLNKNRINKNYLKKSKLFIYNLVEEYSYCFSNELINSINKLYKSVDAPKDFKKILDDMSLDIEIQYENLKRTLKYPAFSFVQTCMMHLFKSRNKKIYHLILILLRILLVFIGLLTLYNTYNFLKCLKEIIKALYS